MVTRWGEDDDGWVGLGTRACAQLSWRAQARGPCDRWPPRLWRGMGHPRRRFGCGRDFSCAAIRNGVREAYALSGGQTRARLDRRAHGRGLLHIQQHIVSNVRSPTDPILRAWCDTATQPKTFWPSGPHSWVIFSWQPTGSLRRLLYGRINLRSATHRTSGRHPPAARDGRQRDNAHGEPDEEHRHEAGGVSAGRAAAAVPQPNVWKTMRLPVKQTSSKTDFQ